MNGKMEFDIIMERYRGGQKVDWLAVEKLGLQMALWSARFAGPYWFNLLNNCFAYVSQFLLKSYLTTSVKVRLELQNEKWCRKFWYSTHHCTRYSWSWITTSITFDVIKKMGNHWRNIGIDSKLGLCIHRFIDQDIQIRFCRYFICQIHFADYFSVCFD